MKFSQNTIDVRKNHNFNTFQNEKSTAFHMMNSMIVLIGNPCVLVSYCTKSVTKDVSCQHIRLGSHAETNIQDIKYRHEKCQNLLYNLIIYENRMYYNNININSD